MLVLSVGGEGVCVWVRSNVVVAEKYVADISPDIYYSPDSTKLWRDKKKNASSWGENFRQPSPHTSTTSKRQVFVG